MLMTTDWTLHRVFRKLAAEAELRLRVEMRRVPFKNCRVGRRCTLALNYISCILLLPQTAIQSLPIVTYKHDP